MTSQAIPAVDAYKIKVVAVLVFVRRAQHVTDDGWSFKVPVAMEVARIIRAA